MSFQIQCQVYRNDPRQILYNFEFYHMVLKRLSSVLNSNLCLFAIFTQKIDSHFLIEYSRSVEYSTQSEIFFGNSRMIKYLRFISQMNWLTTDDNRNCYVTPKKTYFWPKKGENEWTWSWTGHGVNTKSVVIGLN